MTARLVRLPDQFRPARDAPRAATPTCCCCCCCIATLITASVVLPMRVEILDRRAASASSPGAAAPAGIDRTAAKWIAGAAVWIALLAGGLAGSQIGDGRGAPPLILLFLFGLLAVAFPPGHWPKALTTTVVLVVAFLAEFVAGAFLLLVTIGIGYLIVAVAGSWWVIRHHRNLLRAMRMVGGNRFDVLPSGPPSSAPPPPPPLPRPPSSGE